MSETPRTGDPNDPIIVRIEHVEHEIEEVKLYIEGVPHEAKSSAKRRLQYVEDMLSELKIAQQEAEVQKKIEVAQSAARPSGVAG